MKNPLVRALIAHCDSVFYGPNGDYAAVLEAVKDLNAEQALWKPGPKQNSAWQIVEHLTTSKDWQVAMVQGQALPPIVWVEPTGDQRNWKEALRRLEESHVRLRQALEKLTDEELMRIAEVKSNQTLLQLVLSSGPAHEAHHSGQLDYLRGMLSEKQ